MVFLNACQLYKSERENIVGVDYRDPQNGSLFSRSLKREGINNQAFVTIFNLTRTLHVPNHNTKVNS
jgi:hypothetical protein